LIFFNHADMRYEGISPLLMTRLSPPLSEALADDMTPHRRHAKTLGVTVWYAFFHFQYLHCICFLKSGVVNFDYFSIG
jgi:hypothetical protein